MGADTKALMTTLCIPSLQLHSGKSSETGTSTERIKFHVNWLSQSCVNKAKTCLYKKGYTHQRQIFLVTVFKVNPHPTFSWINSVQSFACWVILHAFLSSADFFKTNFFKVPIRVSISLDPDQDRRPDLGPSCLQKLPLESKEFS